MKYPPFYGGYLLRKVSVNLLLVFGGFLTEFHNGQSNRVKKHRSYVKEVAIQKAHNKHCQNKAKNISVGTCVLFEIEAEGVNPMIAVCKHTHNAAGGEHLYHRVVPTRGKERVELL